MVKEFTNSFRNTKVTLMNFLHKYTKDDIELDDEFFETFNKIVEVLGQRIEFEENNLYAKLREL
jgi:meiotically up-regulated gene 157 (Mug157) protein